MHYRAADSISDQTEGIQARGCHSGTEYWIHRRKAALKVRKTCDLDRKPSEIVEIPRKSGTESEKINYLCPTMEHESLQVSWENL